VTRAKQTPLTHLATSERRQEGSAQHVVKCQLDRFGPVCLANVVLNLVPGTAMDSHSQCGKLVTAVHTILPPSRMLPDAAGGN
jgi:hypothetical protein